MGPLDKYILADDALTATPTGFDLRFKSHWYRSLPLSCMDVRATVNGVAIDPATTTISVNGNTYLLAEMPELADEWLFILDAATLHITQPTPLPPNIAYTVSLSLDLHIPYILVGAKGKPLLASSTVSKTLTCRNVGPGR